MTNIASNSTRRLDSAPRSVRSKPLQLVLIGLGIGLVVMGVIGIFLPVMPTTVFLLLAAACFVRSSDRLNRWLRGHRVLGPYLLAVEGKSGIPRKAKVTTLVVLWVSILSSAFIFVDAPWLRVLLITIACGVSIFILSRKTMVPADGSAEKASVSSDLSENPDRLETTNCREAECS